MEIEKEQLCKIMTGIVDRANGQLLGMSQEEIANEWFWKWDEDQSAEWNTYKFSEILELHKRRWRRWEEHHNGSCCVVERVRDKYVMRRVREFLLEIAAH